MKIVVLDAQTVGEDVDWSGYEKLGEVVRYPYSATEEVPERVKDAEVIIVNKVLINEQTVGNAKNLKLVCVLATGTNNLDKEYLESRGIIWHNVAGYSTEAVAQHTFAMLFYLLEKLRYYDEYVKDGAYEKSPLFTHFANGFAEIKGKTWGIIGLGNIGRRVAKIAEAFGAEVIYYSTSGKNSSTQFKKVSFEELLEKSDIISIHAPLNENTKGLINYEALIKMKSSAILVNMGRGPIVVEKDLARAIEEEQIRGAALDVYETEPVGEDNILLSIKNKDKLLLSPHIAWASIEARERLFNEVVENIKAFYNGKDRNRVDK